MTAFFSALNPMSSNSDITFRATKHSYSEDMLQQNMPDLTLDLVISLLWSRHLSIPDGIYETFFVFYGDHFDKNYRGFGQKGILDFTVLPLLSRKLIADTYLKERKDSYFLNFLAWVVALPIKAITFGLALAFTIAITPIVIVVTLLRYLFPGSPPPPPLAGAATMVLTTQTAYAALHVVLNRLELMGIRNPNNIRRLLEEPQNLALVYVMERVTHVVNENNILIENQALFDFLLANRAFWTDVRIIENLDAFRVLNQPFVGLYQLQREVETPVARIVQNFNDSQSTHTASVHNSTSKSASRLKEYYQSKTKAYKAYNEELDISIAQRVRNYDRNLVGQRTDDQILESLRTAINKLTTSKHVDPSSKVSSKDLLDYSWAAVHDSNQWREGVTQETAKSCFYAALYEIDREYALSESGVDNGRPGSYSACEGGTFNKIIEGMAKIHKYCEVNFITPATAALQLPCVVRQVLKEHLANNPHALEQVKKEGLSAVWSELQPRVLQVMQSHFSAIYPSTLEHVNPKLLALVEAGVYTDLTQDLQMLEQQTSKRVSRKNDGKVGKLMMMC